MGKFRTLRGFRDLLPEDVRKVTYVTDVIRGLFRVYGYSEVMTPTIELFDVLSAKVGDEIRHRMYTFTDLGGRKVALRPEMSAPIARLVAFKLKRETKPLRIAYIANCFRYDEPQAGRYREFWQGGFELIGSSYPESDAEILMISNDLMERLGFRDHYFKVGHIGILRDILSKEGIAEKDQHILMSLIDKGRRTDALELLARLNASRDCIAVIKKIFRDKERSFKRVFRKGKEVLAGYGGGIVALENLEEILSIFTSNVKADVRVDLGMARGLEYYTGMIFEVYVKGWSIALNGGGRYDELIGLYGGGNVPAVGCSVGIDRIVLAMERKGLFPPEVAETRVLVAATSPELSSEALRVAIELREEDIPTELEILRKGVKESLSYASSRGHAFFVLIAPRELKEGKAIVRNMLRREQREVPLDRIAESIRGWRA